MTQQGISVGTQPVAVAELSVRTVDLARRVANSDCAVLISGEHGVGKEWIARFIHAVSPRADQPLRVLKCIGCDESTLEQAFAGAVGGTLLIDEVTELSAAAQARLIRLFESSFDVGQQDVRIIATTHRRLAEEVRSGRLRADLYFRLNVFPLMVAPLRERREDILPLAAQLLASFASGGETPVLTDEAAAMLLGHDWPGNIRELQNVVNRAVILSQGALIGADAIELDESLVARPSLDAQCAAAANDGNTEITTVRNVAEAITIDGRGAFARQRDQAERAILLAALRDGRGTRTDIAQRLGISPRTLRYKLARLRAAGMEVPA